MKPRILLVTNEKAPGDAIGQIDAYKLLAFSEELGLCSHVSHRKEFDDQDPEIRVLNAIREQPLDLIIIWSPTNFPNDLNAFHRIMEVVGRTPIIYWEGDPWTSVRGKKPVTNQMSWWMSVSKIVFSTVLEPHFSIFRGLGARDIRFIPNTYCHIKFRHAELHSPRVVEDCLHDVVMIANNNSKIPGISGNPGSFKRLELAFRLRLERKQKVKIYGANWLRKWSAGPVAYEKQAEIIRSSKVSVNWDNFDNYEAYSSDRLAIALIAGRPHISTRHEFMTWLPDESHGLFLRSSPKDIVSAYRDILANRSPIEISKLGERAHSWVKFRLSHREAARYIISSFFSEISPPPRDPWGNLP